MLHHKAKVTTKSKYFAGKFSPVQDHGEISEDKNSFRDSDFG